MEIYSKEILDSLELQKSYLKNSCSDVIQNIINQYHAESSQKILEMIFRDKNIYNIFPEKNLSKYDNKYTSEKIPNFATKKEIQILLPESEFLSNEILIGCFQTRHGYNANYTCLCFSNLGRYSVLHIRENINQFPKQKFQGNPLPLTNEYISIIVNFIKSYIIPAANSGHGGEEIPLEFFNNILEIYKKHHPLISELKQNQNILDEINDKGYDLNMKENDLNAFEIKLKEQEKILENNKNENEDKKRKINTRLKSIIDREKHIEKFIKLNELQTRLLDNSHKLIDICSVTENDLIENDLENIITELELIKCNNKDDNTVKPNYHITFNN